MKYFITVIVLVILSADCCAQDGWLYINYGIAKRIPMIKAAVASREYHGTRIIDYSHGLIIKSKYDSVFSITDGTVAAIFTLDSSCVLMLKDNSENFYTYFPLKNTSFVKGQCIQRGDFLGTAIRIEESSLFELTLAINDKTGMEIEEKKMAAMLNIGDSR